MNARETLAHVADWLGWQGETLSFGLRNAFDALRLYDYWLKHQDLPEMADAWNPRSRIAALGYDPMDGVSHEAKTTGATEAIDAMKKARKLIDSVAFVAKEGDKIKPLSALDSVIGLCISMEGGKARRT